MFEIYLVIHKTIVKLFDAGSYTFYLQRELCTQKRETWVIFLSYRQIWQKRISHGDFFVSGTTTIPFCSDNFHFLTSHLRYTGIFLISFLYLDHQVCFELFASCCQRYQLSETDTGTQRRPCRLLALINDYNLFCCSHFWQSLPS